MSGDNLTVNKAAQQQQFFGCCPSLHSRCDKVSSSALGVILMISGLAAAYTIYPSAMAFVIAGGSIVIGAIPIMIACNKDKPYPVVQLNPCAIPAEERWNKLSETGKNSMEDFSLVSKDDIEAAQRYWENVKRVLMVNEDKDAVERATAACRGLSGLLGGVIGSSWGMTTQNKTFSPEKSYPIKDFSGKWPLDVSLMFCLGESFKDSKFFAPQFLWSMHDCLQYRYNTYHFHESAYYHDLEMCNVEGMLRKEVRNCPPTANPEGGCGPLIRNGPVAIVAHSVERAKYFAALQCQTTHGDSKTVASCVLMAEILYKVIHSKNTDPLQIKNELNDTVKNNPDILEELSMALECIGQTHDFKSAILMAATRGGESIAVGAITGKLAGALYGIGGQKGIPQEWIDKVEQYDHDEIAVRAYLLTK